MQIYMKDGKALKINGGGYLAPKASGETWVFNDVLVVTGTVVEYMKIGFTSNAKEWIGIAVDSGVLTYVGTRGNIEVYSEDNSPNWADQAYRTITFLEPPTGNLLTWLQANGTKQ